ncbi:rhodopsin, G0-coupled-like [Argopecten irradians]|uniref:rhodopsin, G0-coupled-like n=1 Tax=Argopecten irradians TaxID=31199 RepID=UPI0037144D8D
MLQNTSSDNLTTFLLPTYAYATIGVFMTGASTFGVALNGIFIYVFWKQTALKTPTNYFILSLSILDFLMSLFGLPMIAISSFAKDWIFGDKGCVYYGFIMTLLGISTISILAAISFDRYIVIVKTHLKPMISQRVATCIIVGCLLYGLAWAIAPLLGWSKYVLEGINISCSVNWNSDNFGDASFCVALLILVLVIPIIVILFCYGNIFYKVKTSGNNQALSDNDRGSKMDRDVAKTILWMTLAFIFSWFPYAIFSMTAVIGGKSVIPPGLTVLPTLLVKLSVVWNPLIYTYRNREIRRSMIELLPFVNSFFNLPCMRIQGQGQIRPDRYQNDIEGMVTAPSTSNEGTQTTSKCLQSNKGRRLEKGNEETVLGTGRLAKTNNASSQMSLTADMFTVHGV